MFEGHFDFGGETVLNNAFTYARLNGTDCPFDLLRQNPCAGSADLLPDGVAPWHDPAQPELSGRFYGVYAWPGKVRGLNDTNRSTPLTEGVDDGADVGATRRTARQVRVEGSLIARGRDALDYGVSWLSAALDGDRCGQHGDGCGLTDLAYFADCPPGRGLIREYTPWVEQRRNLIQNPSFETAGSGTAEVRRNLVLDPAPTSTTGWTALTGATRTYTSGVIRVVTPGAGANEGAQAGSAAEPPGTVSGSVEVKAPVGADLYVQVRPNGSVTEAVQVNFIGTGDWQRVEVENAVRDPSGGTGSHVIMVRTRTAQALTFDVRRAIIEEAPVVGPYFDGSRHPRVRENLATNPRFALNASGYVGSNGTVWDRVEFNGAHGGLTYNPAGTVLAYGPAGASWPEGSYLSMGVTIAAGPGLPEGATVRLAGHDGSNYFAGGNSLPDETVVPREPTTIVLPAKRGMASTVPRFYAYEGAGTPWGGAGIIVSDIIFEPVTAVGEVAAGAFFDGSTGAPMGYATAWEGAANTSASYLYDADFSVSWTGAPNASASVLTGVRVAGVNPVGGVAILSGHWAKQGAKSARLIRTGAAGCYATVSTPSGMTSEATLLITRYQDSVLTEDATYFGRVYLTGTAGSGYFSETAPNEPGETELRAHRPAGQTIGLIVLYGGQGVGESVWFDCIAAVKGNYAGDYFDGSTPPRVLDEFGGALEQYRWTGTPDASQTILETRDPLDRPRTDEEYAAALLPLRRFLHGVGTTSGPLEKRVSNRGDWWIMDVEWTWTAGRPWVFSATEPVQLPITPSVVIQDVPYNLIPYPSAETSGGALAVATNYSTNPSVEVNATGWSGSQDGVGGITSGRVSGELAAVGTSSYRREFAATIAGVGSSAWFDIRQDVPIPGLAANTGVSISMWAAAVVAAGTAGLTGLEFRAQWRNSGGTALRDDVLGTVPVSGGAVSVGSITPPAGAASVLVQARLSLSQWNSSAIVRLYADALAVTVP